MKCAFCGESLNVTEKWDRRNVCPHCGRDLRCCRQCKFYDPRAYNECREASAERIVEKTRANVCDFFLPKGSVLNKVNRTQDAMKALEALFKKS